MRNSKMPSGHNFKKPKSPEPLEKDSTTEFIETESKIDAELPQDNNTTTSYDETSHDKSRRYVGKAIIIFVLVLLGVYVAGIIHGWHGRQKRDYIIIAQYERISRLDLKTGEIKTLTEERGITAVEFDGKENCTFLYNYNTFTIKRKCEKTGGKDLVEGIKNHTSLAYDWISENLYFTDGNKIKFVINNKEYENDNKRVRTVLTDGDEPNKWQVINLIVHPVKGYLFWIKRLIGTNRGMIKRSQLDGTDPDILFKETDIRALHLDYTTNRLYWLHPKNNSSRSSDLNGRNEENEKKWPGLLTYADRYCWRLPKNSQCMSEITDIKEILYSERLKTNACHGIHTCANTICVGAPNNKASCLCPDDTADDGKTGKCIISHSEGKAIQGVAKAIEMGTSEMGTQIKDAWYNLWNRK